MSSEMDNLARVLREINESLKGVRGAIATLNNRIFEMNKLEAARQIKEQNGGDAPEIAYQNKAFENYLRGPKKDA